jgi:hypothetical protein
LRDRKLPHNIHEDEERAALVELAKIVALVGSQMVRYEAGNTPNKTKRDTSTETLREILVGEAAALELVAKEKVLLGFQHLTDQFGGFFAGPLMTDVPDETIRSEIMERGLKQRDAEHVTLAICNACDVILTLDKKILKLSPWLEERFNLKAWRPSRLLAFLKAVEFGQ